MMPGSPRTRRPGTAVAGIASLGLVWAFVSGAVVVAGEQSPGQTPAVFTSEQASVGRDAYREHCAECHMPDLSGNEDAPPLGGPNFVSTWKTRSTKELVEYMSSTMPAGAPQPLEPKLYVAITAHILQSNGGTAGSEPFTATTDVVIGQVIAARSSAAAASTAPSPSRD